LWSKPTPAKTRGQSHENVVGMEGEKEGGVVIDEEG